MHLQPRQVHNIVTTGLLISLQLPVVCFYAPDLRRSTSDTADFSFLSSAHHNVPIRSSRKAANSPGLTLHTIAGCQRQSLPDCTWLIKLMELLEQAVRQKRRPVRSSRYIRNSQGSCPAPCFRIPSSLIRTTTPDSLRQIRYSIKCRLESCATKTANICATCIGAQWCSDKADFR
jgi:hypothetical protein